VCRCVCVFVRLCVSERMSITPPKVEALRYVQAHIMV